MVLQKTNSPKIFEISSGDYLFEEGNTASFAYILLDGEIQIVKNTHDGEQILGDVEKNSIFGEMAILDGESRSANVLAQESCTLIVISSEDFMKILKGNFKVSFALMSELAK